MIPDAGVAGGNLSALGQDVGNERCQLGEREGREGRARGKAEREGRERQDVINTLNKIPTNLLSCIIVSEPFNDDWVSCLESSERIAARTSSRIRALSCWCWI